MNDGNSSYASMPSAFDILVTNSIQGNNNKDLFDEPSESTATSAIATLLENLDGSSNLDTIKDCVLTRDPNEIIIFHKSDDKLLAKPSDAVHVAAINHLSMSERKPTTIIKKTEMESIPTKTFTETSIAIVKKDDELKQNENKELSHPVSLITGEYVPEQAQAYAPNSDGGVLLPTATNPNANETRTSSRSGKKVRYNPADNNNGIIPGAVRVAGNNRSVEDSSHESTRVDDDDDVRQASNGETPFPMEIDGFLPTVTESKYLIPEENVQRIDHMYASIEPKKGHEGASHERTGRERHEQHFMKKNLNKICILGVMIVLIVSAIVVITICGIGSCHRDNQESQNEQQNNGQDNGQDNGQQSNDIESIYKSFDTKQELLDAIDQFLSKRNVSSLELTYGRIADWNVSQIQDFSHLFSPFEGRQLLKSKFNEDISRWDTSSVTNMSFMFYGAQDFRHDISKWNVSRVTDIQYFVAEASKFDGNLSKWDTSQFVNTSHMFYDTTNFTGTGLETWNVARVYDMTAMFALSGECYSTTVMFHGYCKTSRKFNCDLSNWDVSNVHYMSSMFEYASSFDANLSKWNISNVQDTSYMFNWAVSFQGVGTENWDTSGIETMHSMFFNALAFDANLSKWNLSNVQDTSFMFDAASSFQGIGIADWDTSNIETMFGMFYSASSFDADLTKWNISNVQDTSYMFGDASSFQGVGIEDWDTSNVKTMSGMFTWASSFDANLSKWNLSNVLDTSSMFYYASSFQGAGIDDWDTSKVETMYQMFSKASSFDANLAKWNLSNVQDTSDMFDSASSFQGVGLENWDTAQVEAMWMMFYNASLFDANLSSWDVGKVVDMSYMFKEATSFHGVGLEVWNVSSVNLTEFMFESASAFNANLSNWDVSNVKNATAMFLNATSFEGVFWWNKTSDTIVN